MRRPLPGTPPAGSLSTCWREFAGCSHVEAIQLITSMWIRIRILPFILMRIRIRNTACVYIFWLIPIGPSRALWGMARSFLSASRGRAGRSAACRVGCRSDGGPQGRTADCQFGLPIGRRPAGSELGKTLSSFAVSSFLCTWGILLSLYLRNCLKMGNKKYLTYRSILLLRPLNSKSLELGT